MHGRIATYRFTGDAHEIAHRAEEGMLPIFQAQQGFRAYSLVLTGDTVVSFSAWESADQADAASGAAAGWIADNLAGQIELLDVRVGEILLSTALGVRAPAGASA
ncbi:MAG TPA: hypothetical protein VH572_07585 [Gaiella sp.]|jgi:hypothetical protein